jgi:hypothetical protein
MKVYSVVAALVLALVLPATASAARFHGRAVGNSPTGNGVVPKHSFPVGAGYGLYFRDREQANTTYRVCAAFRGKFRGCASGRTARAGKDAIKASYDVFSPRSTGTLMWRWSVDGKTVARWKVRITIGD